MKQTISIIIFLLCSCILHAEETYKERVYIYTDKDSYLAGEDIWIKFIAIDNNFDPSISKVGYLEISDSIQPYIQKKLFLEEGLHSSKISIPNNIPSGVYRLSGYTRYMRNEAESSFFTKDIAIINMTKNDIKEKFELLPNSDIEGYEIVFSPRSLATIGIPRLPENTIDINISVSRDNSFLSLPSPKRIPNFSSELQSSDFLPEYEGHIITGTATPLSSNEGLVADIGALGEDIYFFNGQISNSGEVFFYSKKLFGKQEIVTTLRNTNNGSSPILQLNSPFENALATSQAYDKLRFNEKEIMETYIATQLKANQDGENSSNRVPYFSYDHKSYILSEYNQFPTIGETILEFIQLVRVANTNGKKQIQMFIIDQEAYNPEDALVLLDGAPIYNHEKLLDYNPRFIESIHTYNGMFLFGGRVFGGIVSFVSKEKNLPHFQLDQEAQLHEYEFPLLSVPFSSPDYSYPKEEQSPISDFRTTLYWNSFMNLKDKNQPQEISFYTSDLTGNYTVHIEGILDNGEIYRASIPFVVK